MDCKPFLLGSSLQVVLAMAEVHKNTTFLQCCEQKVGSLIVELDRLRCTIAEPSTTQIVDIVQRIIEAKTPQPSGGNSNYSLLYVSS